MSQNVYGKLFYNKIDFTNLEAGVTPQFLCPICHNSWQGKLDLGTNFPATFDTNQKPSFTIPTHNDTSDKQCIASGQKIDLYLAAHKDAKGTRLCIQRSDEEGASGISVNWWVRP